MKHSHFLLVLQRLHMLLDVYKRQIMLYAFTTQGNSVTTFKFTLDNFGKFLSDPIFVDVLKRSLYIAVQTTIVCIILGYPAAYIIANASGKRKMILILLITLPTWINMLVRTLSLIHI